MWTNQIVVALALLASASGSDISWDHGDGCTSVIVAKGGSKDGGTMTSHTDDCMECDFRISKVPAADHEEGSVREIFGYRAAYPRWLGYGRGTTYEPENTDFEIYPWKVGEGAFASFGSIPQVPHTYAYIDGGYGIMNEHQVSIGESTCGALLTALPISLGGKALLEAGELSRIALERCKTAKCAVETMGNLAEKYGYFGADETKGEGGEALQVVDPEEAWVFHIMSDDTGTSAVWVAQRVPEGHMAVVPNQFIIRTVDLDDKENFMGSSNILEVAERNGFWDSKTQGKNVDFTAAFGLDRQHLSPYANLRRWRAMSLAAPSLNLPSSCSTFADEYPFSVKVEKEGGMTVADVLMINRDHYEGTEFDMTKGLAAGPYGDPSRFDPHGNKLVYEGELDDVTALAADVTDDTAAFAGQFQRAISIYRCAYSWVSSARPNVDNALGTVWFGQYAPHASTAVPIYAGVKHVPTAFSTGSLSKFDFKASYWVHAVLGNWADRFYVHTIGDIKAAQAKLENAWFAAQDSLIETVEKLREVKTESEIADYLTEISEKASKEEMSTFTDLLFHMFAKYKDGQRIDDFHAEHLTPTKFFYPKWWLQAVGFFGKEQTPSVESAVSPSSSTEELTDSGEAYGSAHSSFISHALVSLLSVLATTAFFMHFNAKNNEDATLLFGQPTTKPSTRRTTASPLSVELPSLHRPNTTQSYQQIM